jgi:endonuclease YncB( thermonuclease family)
MVLQYMIALILILILLPASIQAGITYDTTILRVIDGDTVVISAPYLPEPLKKELSVRVYGVDTPEKGFRSHCESESLLGEEATEFTKTAVKSSKHQQVIIREWDKYGGRLLGDILLDGKSLRSLLLNNALARQYYGEKKESWCEVK